MPEITTEAVQLQLGEEFWYNVLPVGQFTDPRYGQVTITSALVGQLAANFGKAPTYPPPVKFGHGDGAPSPGIIKGVKAAADGLHIRFDLDEEAAKDVREKRFRFMSAEYSPDYVDKTTGEKIGPALLGVALVNQPAHPNVKPIMFSEGEWKQMIEKDEGGKQVDGTTLKELKELKELELKFAEMSAERDKLAEENEKIKKLADEHAAEAAKAREEKYVAEVKTFCDEHVAKGVPPVIMEKIKPYLLGEDRVIKLSDDSTMSLMQVFNEVLELMPKINLGMQGKQAEPEDRTMQLADDIAARANARIKEEK